VHLFNIIAKLQKLQKVIDNYLLD